MEYTFPTDQHLKSGLHEVAEAIKDLNTSGNPVPEWDAEAGEFTIESIKRWLAANSDGKLYGVDQTLDAIQTCTKVLANEGIDNPVPSTLATPGTDPYRDLGPFRHYKIQGHVDDDSVWHVTGMEQFGNFDETDGRDVFELAPVRYVSHGMAGDKYRTVNSDRPHVGLMPEERSVKPDGTLEPFMCRAVYAASLSNDGKPQSVPGARLWNFTCSHNSMLTAAKKKGKSYSCYTAADYDYLYEMFLLKYANKSSQTVFAGCTGHTEQTPVTVAGTSVPTVTVAKTVADNWPIGSAVMVGSTTDKSRDRNNADTHDIANQANIVKKTVDGDNVVITLDVGNITTEVGQIVSTAPWNPGATMKVVGDGSPYNNKSNREPFKLQGIEVMVGAYEILGDTLVKGNGDGTFGYNIVEDTAKASTSVTADYTHVYDFEHITLPADRYPSVMVKARGLLVPRGFGGSTGAGVGDSIYYLADKNTNSYEVLVFGSLGSGGSAGLRRADLGWWPGGANWNLAGRVSTNGRNGVNADEQPQAA